MIKTSKTSLKNHLENELQIKSSDTVFLFSGLRGLGEMEQGPSGVVEVFENLLLDGCLILPTFSYSWCDDKEFYREETACPLMGSISQITLGRKGYTRTNHPNFSVNVYSEDEIKKQELLEVGLDSFGANSIFHKLYINEPQTKIILLGGIFPDTPYRSTFIHTAQQIENAWYRYLKKIYSPSDQRMFATQFVKYRSFSEYASINKGQKSHPNSNFPIQESFDEFSYDLISRNLLRIVPFGYSTTRVVTVQSTIEVFCSGLKRNPNYGLKHAN
jgi:aminoglycoside N3'-acetyltransferase